MAAPRRLKPRRWIQFVAPMPSWMRFYAQWLAGQPSAELTRPQGMGYRHRQPFNAERVAHASTLAGRRIFPEWVRLIEKREDFRTYFDRLRSRPRFLARELLGRQMVENVEARRKALEAARQAGDLIEIERLTRWVVELAFRRPRVRSKPLPPITIAIGDARRPAPEAPGNCDHELIPPPAED